MQLQLNYIDKTTMKINLTATMQMVEGFFTNHFTTKMEICQHFISIKELKNEVNNQVCRPNVNDVTCI